VLCSPGPLIAVDGIATAISRLLGAALIVAVVVSVVNVVARYGFDHVIKPPDSRSIQSLPSGLSITSTMLGSSR
jgi:hypothetical protein